MIFDRIFRFAITGTRVRNYDGLGGQLLFAWLHQHHVLHWTDTALSFDWDAVPDVVIALGAQIDELYWASIDRPKKAHWLAAYEMLTQTLTPNPASTWARGLPLEVLAGRAEGVHRPGPGRRVPALDVLRGARQEDEAGHRIDRGHHRGCLGSPVDRCEGGRRPGVDRAHRADRRGHQRRRGGRRGRPGAMPAPGCWPWAPTRVALSGCSRWRRRHPSTSATWPTSRR